MSARAACRLERFGFDVVEYVGGKQDWAAAGLASQAPDGRRPPALVPLLREDWPTCGIEERAGDVLERLGDDQPFAVVTGPQDVVVGKLLARQAEDDPDATVDELLVEGPTTVRASEDPFRLGRRMQDADTHSVLVTSKEGRLLGVLVTDDLAELLAHARRHHDHG